AAVSAAVPATAEEPTVESLIHPQSRVEIGIAGIGDESRKFGSFNGMAGGSGVYPIFDASILQRDDKTGTWLRFNAESLGLEGGEFRFEHERQGDWNYFVEGGRSNYTNPNVITTSVVGLGSTNIIRTNGLRREVELEMNRDKLKLGGAKKLGDGYEVSFSAREERKTGMRQWGVQGFFFVAEPIEFTTQEYQGTISYTGKQLQMQAGYLGSIFQNEAERVVTTGSTHGDVSLPLNNMMHQVFVNGGYSFTPTTRGTFNASYGLLTQNETFFEPNTRSGRTDLGGKVHNTLLNLGLSSRPTKDLSSRVKMRYEERNDVTPQVAYVAGSTARTGYNIPFSRGTANTDAEVTYQLPMQFKLVGGIGYEHWDRTSPAIRHASFRTKTDEVSARLDLRRPLLENLSGSIGYVHSERFGSGHQITGTGGVNANDPILWANRSRDKGRATLNWSPTNDFSLQWLGEISRDVYGARDIGPQEGNAYFSSLDANYKFADDWDVSGWLAWNTIQMEQMFLDGSVPFVSRLRHIGKAIGATLTGKPVDNIKFVADLQRSEDTSVHGFAPTTAIATGIGPSLPDIEYRQWLLTLTGDYALADNSGIKLKYGFAHVTARDWTWKGMVYANGAEVKIPDNEQTHFIGLSYYHRW
ncbi:MAG: MtrB/PioB family decaheme-associated outer membrane protein, partial [Alphaproteobacteria bacterium]|nr:MtrB/PioB family decaheme-associated outer membrane protein [Alphaproteobacteria bacterium]